MKVKISSSEKVVIAIIQDFASS